MISTSNNRVLITNFKLIEMCIKSSRYTGDGAYESVVLLPGGEEIELTV